MRYAPCLTLQTLCVALLFILDLHYAEHALLSHVINCAFDQTNAFYLFVCLMLVYSLSPRVQSIPRGPLDNAAMFFYAAIVLCASTRQNGIKKHHRLCAMALVGLSRLELPTSRLSGACSNQLSYNPILVEVSGFEPLTPCLQSRCSTN